MSCAGCKKKNLPYIISMAKKMVTIENEPYVIINEGGKYDFVSLEYAKSTGRKIFKILPIN